MPSLLRQGVVVSKANLNLSPQINSVLHKHERFHGSLYVGLGEYISNTILRSMAR